MTKIKSLPFLPAAPRTAVSRRRDPNRDLCCEGFVITEENALNCSVIPRDVPAPEIEKTDEKGFIGGDAGGSLLLAAPAPAASVAHPVSQKWMWLRVRREPVPLLT